MQPYDPSSTAAAAALGPQFFMPAPPFVPLASIEPSPDEPGSGVGRGRGRPPKRSAAAALAGPEDPRDANASFPAPGSGSIPPDPNLLVATAGPAQAQLPLQAPVPEEVSIEFAEREPRQKKKQRFADVEGTWPWEEEEWEDAGALLAAEGAIGPDFEDDEDWSQWTDRRRKGGGRSRGRARGRGRGPSSSAGRARGRGGKKAVAPGASGVLGVASGQVGGDLELAPAGAILRLEMTDLPPALPALETEPGGALEGLVASGPGVLPGSTGPDTGAAAPATLGVNPPPLKEADRKLKAPKAPRKAKILTEAEAIGLEGGRAGGRGRGRGRGRGGRKAKDGIGRDGLGLVQQVLQAQPLGADLHARVAASAAASVPVAIQGQPHVKPQPHVHGSAGHVQLPGGSVGLGTGASPRVIPTGAAGPGRAGMISNPSTSAAAPVDVGPRLGSGSGGRGAGAGGAGRAGPVPPDLEEFLVARATDHVNSLERTTPGGLPARLSSKGFELLLQESFFCSYFAARRGGRGTPAMPAETALRHTTDQVLAMVRAQCRPQQTPQLQGASNSTAGQEMSVQQAPGQMYSEYLDHLDPARNPVMGAFFADMGAYCENVLAMKTVDAVLHLISAQRAEEQQKTVAGVKARLVEYYVALQRQALAGHLQGMAQTGAAAAAVSASPDPLAATSPRDQPEQAEAEAAAVAPSPAPAGELGSRSGDNESESDAVPGLEARAAQLGIDVSKPEMVEYLNKLVAVGDATDLGDALRKTMALVEANNAKQTEGPSL